MSKYKHQLSPEKITTGKKMYSLLAIGWNKSQITVCRVKIGTPTTTGKNYDRKKKCTAIFDDHQLYDPKSFVFFASFKTFRCSWVSPYLIFRKNENYELWYVSVCVVFCVLCSNQWPDDCTFFPVVMYFDTDGYLRFNSTIDQTTVYFFSGRNFFWL